MKLKHSKLYAMLAVGAFALYLFHRKKENISGPDKIQGIDVTINPQSLADGFISGLNMNPIKKEMLRHGTKKVMNSYFERTKDDDYE
jgi:hypothetical protein